MKYIDADKFIKKFEKMIDDIPASVDSGAGYVIDEVYKIFDSLQQEQPEPFTCGHENGYDEDYLQKKIAKASKTWEGVDADKYLDEVRGREQEQPQVADASKMEQPEVELEKASRNVYESWKGGTMDDFLRDMVELGKALNARKEE